MSGVKVADIKVPKRKYDDFRLTFLGGTLLVILCAFLMVISTFYEFNLSHFILPAEFFKGTANFPKDFVYTYKIIPQLPAVMFTAAFLGRKYGLASVLLYLILGLFCIPVFALGGGPKYVLEYGFGYLLGYIPAVFFAGSIIKSGFTCRNIAQAVLVGVFTIHIIGIFYMIFISAIRHEGWTFISSWIIYQSGIKILYDFALSFAAMFVAKYLKIILWLYMK